MNEEGRVDSDRRNAVSRLSDALFEFVGDIGSDSGWVCRSGSLVR